MIEARCYIPKSVSKWVYVWQVESWKSEDSILLSCTNNMQNKSGWIEQLNKKIAVHVIDFFMILAANHLPQNTLLLAQTWLFLMHI